MLDDLKLLVVDDEETICEGCRRIFTRQGFTVEKCSDACEGLSLAQKNDYSAILLDIKMPTMDGIEFLAALRKERADVPVVLMTGYPSIPNAASAVRLGASDYVTKPFTPEEISQAVHRLLHHKETPAAPLAESPVSTAPYRFWKDSWYQTGDASAIRVGSVPSYAESSKIQSVTLPRIGEVVYQGLPLAAVTIAGRPQHLLPSPLSGVIVSVNEALVKDPALLVNDPCGNGWIACLSPTRFEDEGTACRARCIILYNPEATAATQADKLRGLGCEVQLVRDSEQLDARLNEAPGAVVIVDGPAAGGQGPEVVGWINTNFPAARVIVVAGADANLEAAYRMRRIFYFAVEPFADNEIAEILSAAYQPQAVSAERRRDIAQPLGSIAITNRNGTRVRLQVAPGLLRRESGVGRLIHQKLTEKLFPMQSSPEEIEITPMNLVAASMACDRLLALTVTDMQRLPGSLVRDTKGEYISLTGKGGDKIVGLIVQPMQGDGAPLSFDAATSEALATHLVREMANC